MSSLFNFFDKRVQCCSGRPDIVYRFKNKNLLTFEENLKYRGDLPFDQVKIVDTFKYYQQSLAGLGAIIMSEEKKTVTKLTRKFLQTHKYLKPSNAFWKSPFKKNCMSCWLQQKVAIPYKKITFDSLESVRKNGVFFKITEICSELKQSPISNKEYESSK